MSDDNEQRAIETAKAYTVGYDMGWFRAMESMESMLSELSESMMQSATYKEIVREVEEKGEKMPYTFDKILNILMTIKEQRLEREPILVAERDAICGFSKAISQIPADWFDRIKLPTPEPDAMKLEEKNE